MAGKYTQAADDFAKAMSLGMGERAGDVLWLPYQTVWLHLPARAPESTTAGSSRTIRRAST